MRSNTYVFIDAHIIKCRLHHNNSLKYSVALKSGKDQQVATDYKPSKDLIIEMDTHLALQADKHSYDNFPKLTLIVNVITQSNEKKTVGTTFANFRKEGIQTFQVSECSCKDKAFQVDISFSLRIAEVKSSKSNNNKNPLTQDKKLSYFSQQPTPRESREGKAERFSKPIKEISRIDSEEKTQKLKRIHSEKMLSMPKEPIKLIEGQQKSVEQLARYVQQLTDKMRDQENKLDQLRNIEEELRNQKENCDLLKELLQLEEEKNSEALTYIITLQHSILGSLIPKDHLRPNLASATNFKVIEERDEIIQLNEQLQNDLEIQKQKNNLLELQIDQLKKQLNRLLKQQEIQNANKIVFQQISIINLKNQPIEQETNNHQILIASVCKENKENSIINMQKLKIEELTNEVNNLQKTIETLHNQIEKLQSLKKELDNALNKKPHQKKVSPLKPQQAKKDDQAPKSEKGGSKDKNWKPPIKTAKKSLQNSPSNVKSQTKTHDPNAKAINQLDSGAKIVKLASTEVESKTQRQESIQKFSDYLSFEEKSQKNMKTYNQAVYFTDGFQN